MKTEKDNSKDLEISNEQTKELIGKIKVLENGLQEA